MPRSLERRLPGWLGLLGVLATSLGAMGCPGTLDPSLLGPGSGGSSGTSGAGGTSSCNQDAVVTMACVTGCHDSTTTYAGLDMTPGTGVAARLIGVVSAGTPPDSQCGGVGPYLKAGSNPAAGLLIDKMTQTKPPCGSLMPFGNATLLPAVTQTCIEQWAEGVIMGTSQ